MRSVKPLVVVDENIPGVHALLDGVAAVRTAVGREIDPATLEGAQALLVRSVTPVNEALLAGSQLRFIGSATSGTDHVDLEYLRSAGIPFAHAPGSNANSVVEYVLTAIAAFPGRFQHLLAGGRVGIVGFGVIGRLMASRLRHLGIEYCAYDPWLDSSRVENPAELEQVLASEVVTLHAALTHRQPWPSYHLLGEKELSYLREGALLVNASRGEVVDNRALLDRLMCGELAADLVLDVWEDEPRINRELLRRVALGTPHIAGYSYDGKLLATRMLCEKLAGILGLNLRGERSSDALPLSLVPTSDDEEFIRRALSACYDIRADDASLRAATLAPSSVDAAAAFDRLRREYPVRRELAGTPVAGARFSERQLSLLRALGCRVAMAGPEL
jgi:erythronate-4-phosphate dehydrogenase